MVHVILSDSEQRRVQVLERLASGSASTEDAARVLGISVRQVWRLLAAYRRDGMSAIAHGNQGRAPANKTSAETARKISALAGKDGPLAGLNVCHLQEVLAREHQIEIGRATLDRLLVADGLRKRSRSEPPRHRRRRTRSSAEGMMLQVDGSDHDWLEGRGSRMCLIGAIDDATSRVLHLEFRPTEDQAGYLRMLRQIVSSQGIPMSIYHDKHTILRSPKAPTIEEELCGRQPMSQVQRVMEQLGIESIPAHSPQAKGRIERLWGTLQSRLTAELRLAGVATLEAANALLPEFIERHNARFTVKPACAEAAWVKPEEALDPAYFFAVREARTVKNDHTISWLGKTLLINTDATVPSLAGKRVHVHITPEEQLYIYYDKRRLEYRTLVERPREAVVEPQTKPKRPRANQQTATARRRQMAYLHAGTA